MLLTISYRYFLWGWGGGGEGGLGGEIAKVIPSTSNPKFRKYFTICPQCLISIAVSPFKMNPNLKDQEDQVGKAFARKIRLKSKNWMLGS